MVGKILDKEQACALLGDHEPPEGCVFKNGWLQIGKVAVDSGQLMINDPVYINSEWDKKDDVYDPDEDPKSNFSYAAASARDLVSVDSDDDMLFSQLKFKRGHDGIAVSFNSGFGDGVYPVMAQIKDFGKKGGKRITSVRIDMEDNPIWKSLV